MPRNETGRPRGTSDQEARRVGQNNDHGNPINVKNYTIRSCGGVSHSILAEVEDAPLIPLRVLLLTDASPREICRRLRLNLVIRLLVDAIAEVDCAGDAW
jgi:hypothetical protein